MSDEMPAVAKNWWHRC